MRTLRLVRQDWHVLQCTIRLHGKCDVEITPHITLKL